MGFGNLDDSKQFVEFEFSFRELNFTMPLSIRLVHILLYGK